MHDHVGSAGQHTVHHVHGGSHEQEGEFQGLGDTGEHGGGRAAMEQQAAHSLTFSGFAQRYMAKATPGQAKDHQGELAGHETGGGYREMGDAGVASSAKKMCPACLPPADRPQLAVPPTAVCQKGM